VVATPEKRKVRSEGWLSVSGSGGSAAPRPPRAEALVRAGRSVTPTRLRANEHPGSVGAEGSGLLTRILTTRLDESGSRWGGHPGDRRSGDGSGRSRTPLTLLRIRLCCAPTNRASHLEPSVPAGGCRSGWQRTLTAGNPFPVLQPGHLPRSWPNCPLRLHQTQPLKPPYAQAGDQVKVLEYDVDPGIRDESDSYLGTHRGGCGLSGCLVAEAEPP
jgi:hypothetical protein